MNVTRRCFLKFCGGATAGAIISPLPWKLLDDVSIWTQNGSWVAHPPHGPVTYMHSTCTLCPSGCGLNLRRVGENTVSTRGVPGHPLSDGQLCPSGLGSAQIRFHPSRIRGTAVRGRTSGEAWRLIDTDGAISEAGKKLAKLHGAGNADRVAILDLRPGRSLSVLYREFLTTTGGGRYLTLPGGREQAAAALGDILDLRGQVPGYDFAKAKGVLSIGAPVFDGWCSTRHDQQAHVIQVESNGSMNTSLADSWLPGRPGTEGALVLGLIHILRHELANNEPDTEYWPGFNEAVARHTPDQVAAVTGIKTNDLFTTARDLLRHGPMIAVGGGIPGSGPLGREEELAIWALNLTLGNIGVPGGIVLRPDVPEIFGEMAPRAAESLWEIPDGSLDLLLVDGSLPGTTLPRGLLRRKMRSPTSLIVGLSPYVAGATAEADMVIPTTAPGEWLDDVPPQALAPRASYAYSAGVEEAPSWAFHPADLLDRLAVSAGLPRGTGLGRKRHEEILGRRLATLAARGTGEVFEPDRGKTRNLADISPSQLKKFLTAGGCWTEPAVAAGTRLELRSADDHPVQAADLAKVTEGRLPASDPEAAAYPLTVVLGGQSVVSQSGILPPVVNKLYRESNLKTGIGTARINLATGCAQNLKNGQQAILETPRGDLPVVVKLDQNIMPGVVLMSSGPDPESMGDPDRENNILDICGAMDQPVWRIARAKLRKV